MGHPDHALDDRLGGPRPGQAVGAGAAPAVDPGAQFDRQGSGCHRQHGGAGDAQQSPAEASHIRLGLERLPMEPQIAGRGQGDDRLLDIHTLDEMQHGDGDQEGEADQPGSSLAAADAPGQHDQAHRAQGGQRRGRLGHRDGKQLVQEIEPVAERLCQCRQQGEEPRPQDHQRPRAPYPPAAHLGRMDAGPGLALREGRDHFRLQGARADTRLDHRGWPGPAPAGWRRADLAGHERGERAGRCPPPPPPMPSDGRPGRRGGARVPTGARVVR